jgi:2-(1,2-epoxy-1,2-dihydrophenyl)acetyl-CoA isomerase
VLPGAAAGAGIGLALACDLRFGCPATVFVPAFASIALSGDFGVAWLLTRVAGSARARRLLLTGERVDAGTALAWGLLDEVVESPLEAGLAAAASLAAGPGAAYAAMRQNLLDAERVGLTEAMDAEVARHLASGATDDHREAVRAFVEKRPPRFHPR